MLLAHNCWQADAGSACASAISGDVLMRYRRIHVPVNAQIFHISIGDVHGGHTSRTRYIVDEPMELLHLLKDFRGRKITVVMQTELNEKSEYKLFGVDGIIQGFSENGNIVHKFLCDDGTERFETFAGNRFDNLIGEKIVWSGKE